jgi:hypothetical protein
MNIVSQAPGNYTAIKTKIQGLILNRFQFDLQELFINQVYH